MDTVTLIKGSLGIFFGICFSWLYHTWQLKSVQKKMASPTTYLPYRGMIQRLFVTSSVIFITLLLVPEPKFPFILGMVLGMIISMMMLLSRLSKMEEKK